MYEYLGPLAIKILKVVGQKQRQRQSKWMWTWTGQMVLPTLYTNFLWRLHTKKLCPNIYGINKLLWPTFCQSKSGARTLWLVKMCLQRKKETKRRFPYRLSICRPKWLRLADMAGWVLLQQAHLWRVSDSPHTILVLLGCNLQLKEALFLLSQLA